MNQDVQLFASTVTAVFLEASPFLLLGALLSSLVEAYLPQDRIEKYLPKSRLLGLLFALMAGMLIPTCECGVVSIVRRFLRKGIPPHVAITYMLSAPVINPLVLASTYIAFRGDMAMVLARVFVVALCASCMGLMLSGIKPILLLREGKTLSALVDGEHRHGGPVNPDHALHACFHMAHGCACGCETQKSPGLIEVLAHTAAEFLEMGKYLVLGALAVGFFKVLLSQDLLLPFEDNVFLAIGAMMLLAVLLSICSEADAFVAASFSSFPKVAQLSFMTLGPMVDLKLIVMYSAVFHKRLALALMVVPTVLVYVLSFLFGMVVE
jgi:hypothetical protein